MAATPLMKQYEEVKTQYKDCLLLYRMGDFYELFHDDAIVASKVLGLTLTSRNAANQDRTPLAGFPYHAIEKHMPKLVNAGYKVAICEQVEDPATAKGIVKRDVIEVITKGTAINDNCLDAKSNNFLAALFVSDDICGLAYLDLSTGQFACAEGTPGQTTDELYRLGVTEVLVEDEVELPEALHTLLEQEKILITRLHRGYFNYGESLRNLARQFHIHSLEAFGLEQFNPGISAAGAVLGYVKEHKKTELNHIIRLNPYFFENQMMLDSTTIRNLELIRPMHQDDESGTLFHLLDKTDTAMGGRALKYWITHPLVDIGGIENRQRAIEELVGNPVLLGTIKSQLREINDIERIVSKVGAKRANARDLLGLGRSLLKAHGVSTHLKELVSPEFKRASDTLAKYGGEGEELMDQFVDNPPLTIREGKMLNPNKHPELEAILEDAKKGKEWISNLEQTVKNETGIPTLKVGFNKVFGYYLEVTKQHSDKVPDTFIRKQTLVNGERFITPEMKEWEAKILNAEGKANSVEYEIFCQLREELSKQSAELLDLARLIGDVDVLCSLASVARQRRYCKPNLSDDGAIKIQGGRHPVVESITEAGQYIANDLSLNSETRQILLMTGPNMSGKSTYLRQAGLIVLMAQMGSFVPAEAAEIGVVDRIFTRVGASDRLARGQSTFMVEMLETASILNNATPKSLILLDEIGRGTSTFDGLSLAWAIVEALHESEDIAARTLFATHYHELTELPSKFQRIVNIQVAVKEVGREVIFLHKVLEGPCDSSYGIQVAGMAGIPKPVIDRAWEVLEQLEKDKDLPSPLKTYRKKMRSQTPTIQGDLFSAAPPPDPKFKSLFDDIMRIRLEQKTPLELMNKVYALQEKYREG